MPGTESLVEVRESRDARDDLLRDRRGIIEKIDLAEARVARAAAAGLLVRTAPLVAEVLDERTMAAADAAAP